MKIMSNMFLSQFNEELQQETKTTMKLQEARMKEEPTAVLVSTLDSPMLDKESNSSASATKIVQKSVASREEPNPSSFK